MKNLCLIFCFLPFLCLGQKEGRIIYTETIQLGDIELPPEMAAYKDMFPSSKSTEMSLAFTASEGIYQTHEVAAKEKESASIEEDHVQIEIKTEQNESVIFTDLKNKEHVKSQEIFGKKFLIENPLKVLPWKMLNEQKEILGYNCMKAVCTLDSNKTVVAWFTPQIPVSIGPATYQGLPGAILALSVGEDKITIAAKTIEMQKGIAGKLERPTKGKKVTQAAFDQLQEEKIKEMQEMYGGKGNVIIQMDRN
ncbi:MAG: GLPGLI family protein [Saprospiraceae bacterium]